MNFLNLDARVIHPMLDSDCPEIAVHYHEIEKTARTQMAVLGTTLGRLESLAGKFIEQLTGKSGYVNWSVQRFCQIVDNDGKPLGVGMRILDNCTTPLVPKPKSWAPEVKTPVPVSTSGDPSLVAPSS